MHNIDQLLTWIKENRPTLFLDRDGVINKRIPGAYVEKVEQFNFFPNLAENFKILNIHIISVLREKLNFCCSTPYLRRCFQQQLFLF